MNILISLDEDVYKNMVKELGSKTIGNALQDPIIMAAWHIHESVEHNHFNITPLELEEIASYLHWRFSGYPEPDWDHIPEWLLNLEECRKKTIG